MVSDGSYHVSSFATNIDVEITRLNAQVDLFWAAEGEMLSRYGLHDGMSVLDCGCGPGRLIELVKSRKPSLRCTGLEVDPILVETANRRLAECGFSDCMVVQGTAENPGLKESSFDRILLRLVLEHIPSPDAALKSLAKLLKPGGRIVVIDNDFEYHLRTFPPVPQLGPLYAAYCASRRNDGGDPCIGRRLPHLLAEAGLSVVGNEIVMAHNAILGDGPFLKSEGAGIPARLVSTGFLDEKVLEALTKNWLAMLSTPGHSIVRQLFVAVGERPIDDKKRDEKPGIVSAMTAAAGGSASATAGAPPLLSGGGSLELLLELLPIVLGKGGVGKGDALPALGIDSIAALTLQELVRERTGIEIPIVKVLMDVTVEGLATQIDELLGKHGRPVLSVDTLKGASARKVEEEI